MQSADDLMLDDALGRCAGQLASQTPPAVLLYSASRCSVASLFPEGDLRDAAGGPVSTLGVFEARAFGPQGELRWLHHAGGRGRAVMLSETAHPPGLGETWPVEGLVDKIEQCYLVWGAVDAAPAPGWCTVAESQIGRIDLPVEAVAGQRLRVVAREYLGRVDSHGNVAVVEERLVRLEVANG